MSDEEALQIIAVLADVLDGHDVRDAVRAAWSLLGNRPGECALALVGCGNAAEWRL